MARVFTAFLLVLLVIYLVPFLVYGVASVAGGPPPPGDVSPVAFLLGVLVTKLGTAIAFVLIFSLGRSLWAAQWRLYALIWFVMFALSEVGDLVAARTTGAEALLGILSEAIYAPLAAFGLHRLLGNGRIEA